MLRTNVAIIGQGQNSRISMAAGFLIAASMLLLLSLFVPVRAGNAETQSCGVDQAQPVIDGTTIGALLLNGYEHAQVVTQGVSGSLTRVSLPVACSSGGSLKVEIRGVTGGRPNGTVLASQVYPQASLSPSLFTTFANLSLSNPVFFPAGAKFAIVFTPASSVNCFVANGPVGNPYAGGDAWYRPIGSTEWGKPVASYGGARYDFPFKTEVCHGQGASQR